jgi:hypothetical protein
MKALNIALIVLTAAVASGAALLGWCAWRSANGGVIFPNVCACGINFGGLTPEEAAERLAESDFAAYNGKAVVVDFPSGFRLEVAASAVGLEADCAKAARELYAFGRHADPVRRTLAYLSCLFKKRELFGLPQFHLDEAALRALIARAADCVNVEARPGSYIVEKDRVKYTRGETGLRADEAALFGLITDAFRRRSYTPLKYEPQTTHPAELSAEELFALVHKEPADASFDESFNIIPESCGVTFDVEAAGAALRGADYGQTVEIPLQRLEPKVRSADLEALLYRDRLASVTTQLTGNEVRSRNIQLAAAQIDGHITPSRQGIFIQRCRGRAHGGQGLRRRDGLFLRRAGPAGGRRHLPAFLHAVLLLPSGQPRHSFQDRPHLLPDLRALRHGRHSKLGRPGL